LARTGEKQTYIPGFLTPAELTFVPLPISFLTRWRLLGEPQPVGVLGVGVGVFWIVVVELELNETVGECA
jgi:hypothetical protein